MCNNDRKCGKIIIVSIEYQLNKKMLFFIITNTNFLDIVAWVKYKKLYFCFPSCSWACIISPYVYYEKVYSQ